MNCDRYAGKVAIVTGASSGIGAATARRLAAEGGTVILADIADEAGRDVTASIEASGGNARFVHCDVTDSASWSRVHDLALADYGRLDLLHGNAYVDRAAPLHEVSREDWSLVLDVALSATYFGVRTFLAELQRSGGSIVLTSSVHAHFGLPAHPEGCAHIAGASAGRRVRARRSSQHRCARADHDGRVGRGRRGRSGVDTRDDTGWPIR